MTYVDRKKDRKIERKKDNTIFKENEESRNEKIGNMILTAKEKERRNY